MLNKIMASKIAIRALLKDIPNSPDEMPKNVVSLLCDVIESGHFDKEYELSDNITILMLQANILDCVSISDVVLFRVIAGFMNSFGHRRNLWLAVLVYLPCAHDFTSRIPDCEIVELTCALVRNTFRNYQKSPNDAILIFVDMLSSTPEHLVDRQLEIVEQNRVLLGISQDIYAHLHSTKPSLRLPIVIFDDESVAH